MTAATRAASALAAALLVANAAACRLGSNSSRDLPTVDAPVVLFFGDSITRGQGVAEDEAFPSLIQRRLREEGLDYRCINAGVSGDTTEAALRRVAAYARAHPHVVFVELGANDAFRGVNRLRTEHNLAAIVKTFSDDGAHVIVAGTTFPNVQHPALMLAMSRLYEEVAGQASAALIPDLLDGVAGVAELNAADGIHPNAKGHQRLAATAWPAIRKALD